MPIVHRVFSNKILTPVLTPVHPCHPDNRRTCALFYHLLVRPETATYKTLYIYMDESLWTCCGYSSVCPFVPRVLGGTSIDIPDVEDGQAFCTSLRETNSPTKHFPNICSVDRAKEGTVKPFAMWHCLLRHRP